jgi:hypothetical protein
MLHEVIIPTNQDITLHLPKEMVGKTVEVIAFERNEVKQASSKAQRLIQIEELTKDTLVDLSGFKFDRDEANNYGG